ncbi:hypothetical protein Tsubulata_031523, partial [Turnera subulata]
MLDGAALSTFLNGWAATARGCKESIFHPSFIASSLFPANDAWLKDSSLVMWGSLLRKGKCITRRFVFDASAISTLKDLAASPAKCPTRVEAVSALLWKCTMAASEQLHGCQRPSVLTHLVNLRRRIASADNSLGNLLWIATAQHMITKPRPELKDLVGKVREGIVKIDDKFVETMRGDEGDSVMSKSLNELGGLVSKDGVDHIGFSSWCNFGYYNVADFGWGGPVWVSSIGLAGSPVMNLVILADTRMEGGIEAWLIVNEPSGGTYVTSIQANVFECGGIAIGLCISHKMLDGTGISIFLNAWAASARGCKEAIIHPSFTASSLFPANDLWLRDSSIATWVPLFREGKCKTKRFVFNASAISLLKDRAASSFSRSPTRVEVVSALLWKCIMAASEELHGFQRPSIVSHYVNLRRRITSSPLPDNFLGNLLWIATAKHMTEHSRPELKDLVGKVRKGIAEIDDQFVERMKGDEGKSLLSKSLDEIGGLGSKEGEVDYVSFTSWCNLGFYDVDFGWGNPVWVSSIGLDGPAVMNFVILADTRSKLGIEAWVTMDEKHMAVMEGNSELLKFASFDPSPLATDIFNDPTI